MDGRKTSKMLFAERRALLPAGTPARTESETYGTYQPFDEKHVDYYGTSNSSTEPPLNNLDALASSTSLRRTLITCVGLVFLAALLLLLPLLLPAFLLVQYPKYVFPKDPTMGYGD
jgi:hypothetical protein